MNTLRATAGFCTKDSDCKKPGAKCLVDPNVPGGKNLDGEIDFRYFKSCQVPVVCSGALKGQECGASIFPAGASSARAVYSADTKCCAADEVCSYGETLSKCVKN